MATGKSLRMHTVNSISRVVCQREQLVSLRFLSQRFLSLHFSQHADDIEGESELRRVRLRQARAFGCSPNEGIQRPGDCHRLQCNHCTSTGSACQSQCRSAYLPSQSAESILARVYLFVSIGRTKRSCKRWRSAALACATRINRAAAPSQQPVSALQQRDVAHRN